MLFVCLVVIVRGAKALRAATSMSSRGVSDTDATLELSLLLNGRSFVGREVARRVVSAAAERGIDVRPLSLRHRRILRTTILDEIAELPAYFGSKLRRVAGHGRDPRLDRVQAELVCDRISRDLAGDAMCTEEGTNRSGFCCHGCCRWCLARERHDDDVM